MVYKQVRAKLFFLNSTGRYHICVSVRSLMRSCFSLILELPATLWSLSVRWGPKQQDMVIWHPPVSSGQNQSLFLVTLSLEKRERNKQKDVTMSVPAFGTPVLLFPCSTKGQEETGITIPLIKVAALKVNDKYLVKKANKSSPDIHCQSSSLQQIYKLITNWLITKMNTYIHTKTCNSEAVFLTTICGLKQRLSRHAIPPVECLGSKILWMSLCSM